MRKLLWGFSLFFAICICYMGIHFINKYRKASMMVIPVEEVSTFDYPEDPSHRSVYYDSYGNRHLKLVKLDDTHFDFIFESTDPNVATIAFKGVDVSLYIPIRPEWTKTDLNLEIISLVDREWNRQQVSFPIDSPHIEVTGGDGFEKNHIFSAELARNCLNAGLWEVQLYTKENGKKALYYQGWFEFPLGHYKEIFEAKNGISYWNHWYRLEHWVDPEGLKVELSKLREVITETEIVPLYNKNEKLVLSGEQLRKSRTLNAKNVRCLGDFCVAEKNVQFARFIPPGRYSFKNPWNNEFERIAQVERAIHRKVRSPATSKILDEVEIIFRNTKTGEPQRFIVSGIDIDRLPQIPGEQYPQGLYMPMGIGVPPFYQTYQGLQKNPPYRSPYFSVLLDGHNRWINHHDVGIDGPVMHRDQRDPHLIHLYLLSYERHALVGHYMIPINR